MSIKLPSRSLVSQQDQSMIPRPRVPRSKFSGSWTHKKTMDPGLLYPFMFDEVYPGDHMSYAATAYVRMQTLLFPLMDNQRVDIHFWAVPIRLLWGNFKKFMGEQGAPGDSINFTIPQVVSPAGGFAINSIYDHFGLPCVGQITAGQTISVNSLPLRAYALIYNENYRDQNLQTTHASAVWPMGDGPDSAAAFGLAPRAKSHDYFTSALPWAQKFTAPNVPLSGLAPIIGMGVTNSNFGGAAAGAIETMPGGGVLSAPYAFYQDVPASVIRVRGSAATSGSPMIYADLAAATATMTINTLRNAWAIQSLYERDARGGTRYIEIMKAHFDVTSPDARMQRPEYIGGGSTPLVVTPIAQTGVGGSGLGALGGVGTGAGQNRASYAATEHCYIIGLISIKSELSYQQGIHRFWRRFTRNDMYWPDFALLGEQAILREELYATGTDVDDNTVFGYQERYQELRTRYSEVTGMFRSTHAGTIDQWHLSQRFVSPPTLSSTFIVDNPPMSRVYAAGAAAANMNYLCDILIRREAVRPIPVFGTPASLLRL